MTLTEAQKKANMKYRGKSIKRIPLDMKIADYEELKAFVESNGETVNGFIKRAIREAMQRDNK